MINAAESGRLSHSDLEGKPIEQLNQETIDYCKEELKNVCPNGIGSLSFTVHLLSLTNGRIAYNLAYDALLQIEAALQLVL